MTAMKRKVIESFQYAADGRQPRLMRAGRSYEFPAGHAERFEREGRVEPMPGQSVRVERDAADIEGSTLNGPFLSMARSASSTRKARRRK